MATAFNGCSIYNGRIASNKLWDYKYFLVTVLLEKTKELSKKKRHFYWVKFLRFSAGNLLQLFKNKSMKALVDQYDIKFVFCMKSWFLGFIISLMTDAKFFNATSVPLSPTIFISPLLEYKLHCNHWEWCYGYFHFQ